MVETPGDFGGIGARLSNQPPLGWLACELRSHKWSTKHLYRLIVTSAAFVAIHIRQLGTGNEILGIDTSRLRDRADSNPRPSASPMLAVAGRLDSIGATDDVGYTVVDRPKHPINLHSTMLDAFGIEQHSLWFQHRDEKRS